MNFKVGDRVICISNTPRGHYQCDVGAIATIRAFNGDNIYTVEDICTCHPNDSWACYHLKHFKLYKPKISFNKLYRAI